MNDNTPDSTELRQLFAQWSSEIPGEESDCPPPEKIWEAVRGQSPPAEVERLLEHTLSCAACSEDWRLAVAVNAEAESDEGARSGTAGGAAWWHRKPVWLAAAAAVIIAVGIQVSLNQWSEPPVFRAPDETSAPTIQSLIPEGASLPRDGFLLKWRPGPEGTLYSVRVVTEDLQPVASARNLAESEYLVPESSLGKLTPGARLFWEVRMETPDGNHMNSPVFSVRLQP